MKTKVVVDFETSARLAELGLDDVILQGALSFGESERRTCTTDDPKSMGGWMMYGRTVRALREGFGPRGWRAVTDHGLELLMSPDEQRAVLVCSGDAQTGLPDGHPRTKSEKGPATVGVVNQNQYLLPFLDLKQRSPIEDARATWVLLHYRDHDRKEVRAELSLPSDIDEAGNVIAWSERIILKSIPLFTGTVMPRPEEEPQIDIPVMPKG